MKLKEPINIINSLEGEGGKNIKEESKNDFKIYKCKKNKNNDYEYFLADENNIKNGKPVQNNFKININENYIY